MSKQRQIAVIEEAGEGRGRRATLVQEQDFRVLDAREGLALTEIETPYLVRELEARGVSHPPNNLHHALEGAYELAKGEFPRGKVLKGVKGKFLRVASEKEGGHRPAGRVLGCNEQTVRAAYNAIVKRGK